MDRLMELKGRLRMIGEYSAAKRFIEQGLSENYSGKATADKEEEAAVEYVEALDDAGLESDEDDDKDENTDDSDAADAAQVEDDSEDDAGSEITDNDAGLSDVE